MKLQDKVAIVTGAASGFGRAIAERFALEGARVILADINGAGVREVAAGFGDSVIGVTCDVSRKADVEAMVRAATEAFGGLDIMVNNAGTTHRNQPLIEVGEAEFDRIYAVNVKSIYLTIIAAVPHMERRGAGIVRCRRIKRRGAVEIQRTGQRAGLRPGRAIQRNFLVRQRATAVGGAVEHLQQALVVVFHQRALGLGVAQQQHVMAGFLLRRIVRQGAGEGYAVRRIDDHQLLHVLRVGGGEGPGDGSAPVVGDQDAGLVGPIGLQVFDQLAQVFQQRFDAVGGDAFGLVGKIVAAQVEGHGAMVPAELFQLAFPRMPELGKAVDEEHQRGVGGALGYAVQANAVDRREKVFHQSLNNGSRFCMLAVPASNRSLDISIAAFQVAM